MKTFIIAVIAACVLPLAAHYFVPSADSDNLVGSEFFTKELSWLEPDHLWMPFRNRQFKIENGVLILKGLDGKRNNAGMPLRFDYATAEAFEVSFQYRSNGKSSWYFEFYHPERQLPQTNLNSSGELAPQSGWTLLRAVVKRAPESLHGMFSFYTDNSLEVKNVKIKPVEPRDTAGKPVMLDGKRCTAIYYREGDYGETLYNRNAAQILRCEIHRAGGELLPVKSGDGGQEPGIYIGGPVSNAVKTGGFELTVTTGKAVITGRRPGGVTQGAVALLNKLGIIYVTSLEPEAPEQLRCGPIQEVFNPAVPFLYPERTRKQELLGFGDTLEHCNSRKLVTGSRNYLHIAQGIVPFDEFGKEHPEYFAMQPDGQRLRRIPGQRFEEHFCLANPEVKKIFISRFLEYVKAEPWATYFPVFQGDGMGYYCRCQECEALGSVTDRTLAWTNDVAREVGKVFPHVKIMTAAYADIRRPPLKTKPEPNVIVLFCNYEPIWTSHLIVNHPANKTGLEYLAAWEKISGKSMGAGVYPYNFESLNIWPVFYAEMDLYRRFASRQYAMVFFIGLSQTNAGGAIRALPNFAELLLYAGGKVLRNPKTDIEKSVDTFMHYYFGPAAKPMRRYFDRIHREVVERNWEQYHGRQRRGFITKQLAEVCYSDFAEAENMAKGKYLERVRISKFYLLWHDLTDNCRGNGAIRQDDLPHYAAKLAEFCRIGRELRAGYNRVPYDKWFWDTALLKLENKGPWYNDPTVEKLIAAPLNTLLHAIPNVQQKTDCGYLIGNQGILGGERSETTWLRKDPVWATVLRRPHSGLGSAQCILKLDKVPAKNATLKITGIDNEKKAPALMELRVNNIRIYQGNAPWKKDDWSDATFEIPAGTLKKGDNEIMLLNTTPEADKQEFESHTQQRNYYWGWFMITDMKFEI